MLLLENKNKTIVGEYFIINNIKEKNSLDLLRVYFRKR